MKVNSVRSKSPSVFTISPVQSKCFHTHTHTYQKPFSFFSRGYFAFKLELWLPPMMTKGSLHLKKKKLFICYYILQDTLLYLGEECRRHLLLFGPLR